MITWPILFVLLVVTQTPLLVYALYQAKAATEEKSNLMRLAAGSLQLPSSVITNNRADAAVTPPPAKVIKEVRRIQFPIPLGATPREAVSKQPVPHQGDK